MGMRMEAEGLRAALKALRHGCLKTSYPIIGHVYFKGARMITGGFGMEIVAEVNPKDMWDDPLNCTVDYPALVKVINLVKGTVTLEQKGSTLEIKTKDETFTFPACNGEDYPVFMEKRPEIEASMKVFMDVVFPELEWALPRKDPRKVLLGTFFRAKAGKPWQMYTTNGKQLAEATVTTSEAEKDYSAIVPVELTDPIMSAKPASVEVLFGVPEVTENSKNKDEYRQIVTLRGYTSWGNIQVAGYTIDGKYPNVDLVIPSYFNQVVKFSRKTLIERLMKAQAVADTRNSAVVFELKPYESTMAISTCAYDTKYKGTISVCNHSETELKIAFNTTFLIPTLQGLKGDCVTLHILENTAPVILTGELSWARRLVMPIKLTDVQEDLK